MEDTRLECFAEAAKEPLKSVVSDCLNAAAALDVALARLQDDDAHAALCEAWGEDLDRNETRRLVDALVETVYRKLADMLVPRK